jgi:hypothetical protein
MAARCIDGLSLYDLLTSRIRRSCNLSPIAYCHDRSRLLILPIPTRRCPHGENEEKEKDVSEYRIWEISCVTRAGLNIEFRHALIPGVASSSTTTSHRRQAVTRMAGRWERVHQSS